VGQQRKVLTPERSPLDLLGAELRAVRDQRELSLAGLAGRVRYNAGYLGRVERGVQFPTLQLAEACDTELGANGELVRLWHIADNDRRGISGNGSNSAAHQANSSVVPARVPGVNAGSGDGPGLLGAGSAYAEGFGDSVVALGHLVRQDLARVPAGVSQPEDPDLWRELAVRWFTDPDDEPGSLLANGLAAGASVVRAATDMFSGYDYQFGGGRSRLLIAHVLDTEVLPTLRQVTPGQSAVSEYLSEVAAMLRLAAWTAYDIGYHGLAQAYFAQALRLAKAAGDRCLGGRIFAGMSHQANFLGYFPQAVELARAARAGFRGQGTPTATALSWAMEARAQASLKRKGECLHAIGQAEHWLARSAPDSEPPWLRYFDDAELHAEAAHCYRDLGDPQNACRHAELSIQLSKSIYVRSLSFCRTVLATGHLLNGDLDHAIAIASGVVDTAADQVRSRRVLSYLEDFRDRLALYPDASAAREFREYVTERLSQAG
jgi:tetratricopeptide (TPR) repeat protein